jgi:mRNA-degrading endonuclease RelE of RelBE toxin-antitoxin system
MRNWDPMPYQLWIEDQAKAEVERLPGHVRQRIHQAIHNLRLEPRPHGSRAMRSPIVIDVEVRRLGLEHWRVIYVVDEHAAQVGVLAIRKRPPYNYDDLPDLLSDLQE